MESGGTDESAAEPLFGHTAEHTDEQHAELIALANQVMPFGKYKGELLLDLPEPYMVWFHGEGFPGGVLGERMAAMYEVKVNGLEQLLRPLVKDAESRKDQ